MLPAMMLLLWPLCRRGRLGWWNCTVPTASTATTRTSGRCLRSAAAVPDVRVVAVDAVGSVQFHQPNLPRLQSGHSNSIIAGNINYRVISEAHWLHDGEVFNACHELAR